jgi:precorrin-6B methylase 1
LLEQIRRWVVLIVGDPVQTDLEGVLAKRAQTHQGFQVVAHPSFQATLVIDFAAYEQT